jgi:hypothetical protein
MIGYIGGVFNIRDMGNENGFGRYVDIGCTADA